MYEKIYLLGLIKGDGCVSKSHNPYGYRVSLNCIDKEIIIKFIDYCNKLGIKTWNIHKQIRNNKPMYYIGFSNKKFWHWYHSLTIKDIEKIVTKNKKTMIEFVKGFYDAEGCLSLRKSNKYINARLLLSNNNKELINLIVRLLKTLNIEVSTITKYKKNYNLYICDTDMIKKWIKLIGFSIKRKQKLQDKFMTGHTYKWSDEEKAIIKKYYGKIPTKKIANIMKYRNGNGIIGKARRMGLRVKPHKIEYINLKCPTCNRNIKKKLKSYNWRKKHEGTKKFFCSSECHNKFMILDIDDIIERELENGLSGYKIAMKHEFNGTTVNNHINRYIKN
jgi:YHS domain-containing protein